MDRRQYGATIGGTQALLPVITYTCRLHHSSTGALIEDYTGANAKTLHGIIGTLTQDEIMEVMLLIWDWWLRNKAPQD